MNKPSNDAIRKSLIEQMRELETQMKINEQMFNLTLEEQLIEALIYEDRALKIRYCYLLQKAKSKSLTSNHSNIQHKTPLLEKILPVLKG